MFKLFLKELVIVIHFPIFFLAYFLNIFNDKFISNKLIFLTLRKIFQISKGKSSNLLHIPFILLHPIKTKKIDKKLFNKLRKFGYARLNTNSELYKLSKSIKEKSKYFEAKDDLLNLKLSKSYKNFFDSIEKIKFNSSRLIYEDFEFESMQETWDMISLLKLPEIASSYLRCDPILTSICSWVVVPINLGKSSEDIYSWTAQTYHYDMDWIKFIKFFINLNNVSELNGPFEYISGSHTNRLDSFYKQRRFDHLELEESGLDNKKVLALGDLGTCFAADTSGLHRDGRALEGYRQVMQVEFAISTFGTGFKNFYKKHEISRKKIKSNGINFPSNLTRRMLTLYK